MRDESQEQLEIIDVVMSMDLAVLEDAWLFKYGRDWMEVPFDYCGADFEKNNFWRLAWARLKRHGRLVEQYLPDRMQSCYRLKGDADH